MRRRDMLAVAGAGLAAGLLPGVAEARTLAISDLSVDPANPDPANDAFGRLKGVMSFRVIGNPALSAANAWRGIESWGNGDGSGRYQCVDLIRRYAQKLEFPRYRLPLRFDQLPTLGDGEDAAAAFAGESDGGFVPVNGSSSSLPRLGAVVSIREWQGVAGGHTGIVQRVSASGNTATLTLFDQNFPSPGGRWKTLEFTRANNRWTGLLVNNSTRYGTTRNPVVCWANPTG